MNPPESAFAFERVDVGVVRRQRRGVGVRARGDLGIQSLDLGGEGVELGLELVEQGRRLLVQGQHQAAVVEVPGVMRLEGGRQVGELGAEPRVPFIGELRGRVVRHVREHRVVLGERRDRLRDERVDVGTFFERQTLVRGVQHLVRPGDLDGALQARVGDGVDEDVGAVEAPQGALGLDPAVVVEVRRVLDGRSRRQEDQPAVVAHPGGVGDGDDVVGGRAGSGPCTGLAATARVTDPTATAPAARRR